MTAARALAARPLGSTGIVVSDLSLGGAGVLMDRHVEATDEQAAAVVRCALDRGIRLVDTSPIYGTDDDPRRSERRVGLGILGHNCAVATKAGLHRRMSAPLALTGEAVRSSVEASLATIGRASLELVQLHELTVETWSQSFAPGGAVNALQALREEGVIGHVGVTGSDPVVLERAARTGAFESVQLWRAWTLLDRSGDSLLETAAELGVGMLIGAPFASGILARGDASGELHYGAASAADRSRVRWLGRVCADAGISLRAAALRFCLDPRVSSVVVGVRDAAQLDELLTALAEPVSTSLLDELRKDG